MHYRERGPFEIKPWARFCLYWGIWTVLGLVNAAHAIIDVARSRPSTPAWEPFLWEMSSLYTVGLLFPLVRYAVRRVPLLPIGRTFAPRKIFGAVLLHCFFIVPFSLLHTFGMASIRSVVYSLKGVPYRFGGDNLGLQVLYEFYKDLTFYPVLVTVVLAFDYYRRYRNRELLLAKAQLQNLRMQIHPHFLFNTLNMISERMYHDPAEADRMIARLSDLLRFALKSSDEAELPLRTELEMLEVYLEIMKARFSDSVRVDVHVEPNVQSVMVPSLLLQPIVENSFRHGMAQRSTGGLIEIRGSVQNGTVRLIVSDNGPGIKDRISEAPSKGFGLSNTVQRLEQLYGTHYRFELRNRSETDGGGLEVLIEIPSRSGR